MPLLLLTTNFMYHLVQPCTIEVGSPVQSMANVDVPYPHLPSLTRAIASPPIFCATPNFRPPNFLHVALGFALQLAVCPKNYCTTNTKNKYSTTTKRKSFPFVLQQHARRIKKCSFSFAQKSMALLHALRQRHQQKHANCLCML